MSGKTTRGVALMSAVAVFDSDWIYAMYHLKKEMYLKKEDLWAAAVDYFIKLYNATGGLPAYHVIFTADRRIAEFLKKQKWNVFMIKVHSDREGRKKHKHNREFIDPWGKSVEAIVSIEVLGIWGFIYDYLGILALVDQTSCDCSNCYNISPFWED